METAGFILAGAKEIFYKKENVSDILHRIFLGGKNERDIRQLIEEKLCRPFWINPADYSLCFCRTCAKFLI